MLRRFLFTAMLIICSTSILRGQSLPFRSFSSDDGLAQSVVLAMEQDRDGFLWVGTPYGLSRFDGRNFVNFNSDDGLTDNVVRSLIIDSKGRLWVGTDSGLSCHDDGTWSIPYPELEDYSIRSLSETDDGALWAGTYGSGIARIKGADITIFDTSDGLAHNRVRTTFVDHEENLWIGTYGGGLSRYADGSFETFDLDDGLTNLFIRTIFETTGKQLLIGSNRGVYSFVDGRFQAYAPASGLDDLTVTCVLQDRLGRLWMGTRDNGACRISDGSMTCYEQRQGLPDASVNCMLEDIEGNLWFGTFGGGVSRLTTESFNNYTTIDGLPHGNVQAFAEDSRGMWFGTHGGGVALLSGDEFTFFTTDDGLPHNKIFSITGDPSGRLWIGTLAGAAVMDGDRISTLTTSDGLASNVVYFIHTEESGDIWFATLGGLTLRTERGLMRSFTTKDGLPGNRIHHILPAKNGGFWIATDRGLARMIDDTITKVLTTDDGLPDNYIMWIHETSDSSLWIATTHGLCHITDSGIEVLTSEDGLSHNKCSVILEDERHRLWVGTTRGINIIDGDEVTVFTARQGLPSSEVLPGSGFEDSRGNLWFGTVRGATVFDPGADRRLPQPPLTHITRFEVNRRDVINDELHIFKHRQNALRFEFVAPSLGLPDDVRYEYRLEGLDSRFRTTPARFADYPAIPPGNYTFVVRASHDGKTWNPQVTRIRFEIKRPVWQEQWFRILAGLTLIGVTISIHRIRIRAMKQQARLLEAQVDQRTAEVRRERREVKLKNEQLRIIDRVVAEINKKLKFNNLLNAILEGVASFETSRVGLAIVRDENSGIFTVATSLNWMGLPPKAVDLSFDELNEGLVQCCKPIGEGLYSGRGIDTQLKGRIGRIPPEYLLMVIDLDQEPAGFLIFGGEKERLVRAHHIEALERLRSHVASAFIKGRLVRKLRGLNEKKNEFLGIAAHDLRSPLGGIISYTSLLLKLLDDGHIDQKKWQGFLGNINITANQMLSLVNKLLDVSAIEAGRVDLNLDRIRMADILTERCGLHDDAAQEKHINLFLDTSHAHSEVLVDRVRVGQVIDNLLTNAIKFTQPGGQVRVFCEAKEDLLITHVQDSGVGLNEEEIEYAFQGKKLSARPTGGESSTGLGLVIVRKLIEQHDGNVWLISKKDSGSTFSFSLPVT